MSTLFEGFRSKMAIKNIDRRVVTRLRRDLIPSFIYALLYSTNHIGSSQLGLPEQTTPPIGILPQAFRLLKLIWDLFFLLPEMSFSSLRRSNRRVDNQAPQIGFRFIFTMSLVLSGNQVRFLHRSWWRVSPSTLWIRLLTGPHIHEVQDVRWRTWPLMKHLMHTRCSLRNLKSHLYLPCWHYTFQGKVPPHNHITLSILMQKAMQRFPLKHKQK